MTEVLTSYLLQNKSLSIPGLGTIYIERIPAQTDFVNKQILPPGYHFRFDKYFDAPDKDFFTYISRVKDIADYEAIKWYNEWAYEFRGRLRNDTEEVWPNVGSFRKDSSGEIAFQSAGAIPTYEKPSPATRIVRTHTQATMLVGDREVTRDIIHQDGENFAEETVYREKDSWWIYALIIGAIAASALFFHFYKKGFNPASLGNQQRIEISG
ncbi:hypothetical protein HHL16_20885 [Pseudoflavitalea sp. G-6-1-2]|uniref:hypothetical protein n=1 Tax=Pseudoflavitalea sp. G-6-1-2 TaxID=2728841 RepID=UPI00146C59F5|nr:hypothetical protein [Pseudoflavitalea sp. G-6-1-2]NML23348.1 hypothetical protein [Pseudoflavitalea sp. G-6-1-2]